MKYNHTLSKTNQIATIKFAHEVGEIY